MARQDGVVRLRRRGAGEGVGSWPTAVILTGAAGFSPSIRPAPPPSSFVRRRIWSVNFRGKMQR